MEEFNHGVGFLDNTEGQRWERDTVGSWFEGARGDGYTADNEIMRHQQAKAIARWADDNDQLHGLNLMDAEVMISFYIGFGVGVQNAPRFMLGELFGE